LIEVLALCDLMKMVGNFVFWIERKKYAISPPTANVVNPALSDQSIVVRSSSGIHAMSAPIPPITIGAIAQLANNSRRRSLSTMPSNCSRIEVQEYPH